MKVRTLVLRGIPLVALSLLAIALAAAGCGGRNLAAGWRGLLGIRGLHIDGAEATPGLLIEAGPEELINEILGSIRAEIGLSETEIKN